METRVHNHGYDPSCKETLIGECLRKLIPQEQEPSEDVVATGILRDGTESFLEERGNVYHVVWKHDLWDEEHALDFAAKVNDFLQGGSEDVEALVEQLVEIAYDVLAREPHPSVTDTLKGDFRAAHRSRASKGEAPIEVPTKGTLRYWVDSYERRRAIGETIVDYLHARLTERHDANKGETWKTLCVECGPNVTIDDDGCCVTCGNGATGDWLARLAGEDDK